MYVPYLLNMGLMKLTGYNCALFIAIAIQIECVVKSPLCAWRIGGGKWIHDVTRGREV